MLLGKFLKNMLGLIRKNQTMNINNEVFIVWFLFDCDLLMGFLYYPIEVCFWLRSYINGIFMREKGNNEK